jgi:hypothetical protein
MNKPEALRLAGAIDYPDVFLGIESAAELRRLHEVNAELLDALRAAIEQAEKQNPGQVEFDYSTDLLLRIDLIWRILENPHRDFTASDMEHWDEIHDAVRAALIKHEWQGLTDEEIHNLPMYQQTQEEYQLAKAIEAKLKEKNI